MLYFFVFLYFLVLHFFLICETSHANGLEIVILKSYQSHILSNLCQDIYIYKVLYAYS